MTSRTIRCSICHEPGHNCRTCWLRNVTMVRGSQNEPIEDIEMIEEHFLSIEIPQNVQLMTPPPAPRKKKRTITPQRTKQFIQDETTCNICFDELQDTNKVITKCGHMFCVECYTRASRNKNDCAVCRKKLCSVEPENWKRRYEEIQLDLEYYKNIVQGITGIVRPHILEEYDVVSVVNMEVDDSLRDDLIDELEPSLESTGLRV